MRTQSIRHHGIHCLSLACWQKSCAMTISAQLTTVQKSCAMITAYNSSEIQSWIPCRHWTHCTVAIDHHSAPNPHQTSLHHPRCICWHFYSCLTEPVGVCQQWFSVCGLDRAPLGLVIIWRGRRVTFKRTKWITFYYNFLSHLVYIIL